MRVDRPSSLSERLICNEKGNDVPPRQHLFLSVCLCRYLKIFRLTRLASSVAVCPLDMVLQLKRLR